jgi:hypothetical protein
MEICKVESCDYEGKIEGLCYPHYKRLIRSGTTELHIKLCSIVGCEEKHGAKGMCRKHYSMFKHQENKVVIKESIVFKDGNWKVQDESDYIPIIE